jgi:pimeloyl-ACP methyl ester carboxylesterase
VVQALIFLLGAIWTGAAQASLADGRSGRDDRATGPAKAIPTAIDLREGLAIPGFGRERRAAISYDPVVARIVTDQWEMPRPGETLTLRGGEKRRWEPVRAAVDGWFAQPSLRGGYLAVTVLSANDALMVLEAVGYSMVHIAGEPRPGDIYSTGFVQLPVWLRKGSNVFLFEAGRGRLKARLAVPKAPVFLNLADTTTPDLVIGEPVVNEAAVVVVNATESWRDDLVIVARLPQGPEIRTTVPSMIPLSVRKVGFDLRGNPPRSEGTCTIELKVQGKTTVDGGDRWETLDSGSLVLRIRRPGQTHKRTFRSQVDGSVQYYAVVPALAKAAEPAHRAPGLVLTLHGAAVEAVGQADAYAAKPGRLIVAPTNRRPYGFDWEDWGRLDAIEVLELAQQTFSTDPRRTWLTGHSMGGHGTWHLGVTFPDRFAAIAPSAGWISMWSYAGANRAQLSSPVDRLMARATSPSDTLELVRNLGRIGVYILHGDADDNVPVGQARRMRQLLGEFHPDFTYHEQPGAGHWWGNACVDWPPLFEFFERRTIPAPAEVRRVYFVTASPGVSPRAHWVSIEAQEKAMVPSEVHLELDVERRRFHGTTKNVSRLSLDVGRALPGAPADGPFTVELDGQALSRLNAFGAARSSERRIWLVRSGIAWSATATPPPASRKGPLRQGPFKDAFRNRFVLVVGTKGTPEENAWGLAQARFDAETFWYRGNGSPDILTDAMFLEPSRADFLRDRNVILYGHSESNAAWPALLSESPVRVKRGQAQIGQRKVNGDNLACLFIRPRPGSDWAAVGAVAGTGAIGLRLTERLPYFTSGVAYPDCVFLSTKSVGDGSAAPIAAGYFGSNWDIESGEFAWSD